MASAAYILVTVPLSAMRSAEVLDSAAGGAAEANVDGELGHSLAAELVELLGLEELLALGVEEERGDVVALAGGFHLALQFLVLLVGNLGVAPGIGDGSLDKLDLVPAEGGGSRIPAS